MKVHTLLKSSVDVPIITELGAGHKTYLADLWALLEKQPNGEQGTLLVNGRPNVFNAEGVDGTLWAVYAFWDDDGWRVGADAIDSPIRWVAGDEIVSR